MATRDTLANLFMHTMNPVGNMKQATAALQGLSLRPGFVTACLELITSEQMPVPPRLACAIFLKNHAHKYWDPEEGLPEPGCITAAEREVLKAKLLGIALGSHALIKKQLVQLVVIVCKTDFPNKWPTLLPQLVQQLKTGQLPIINNVLDIMEMLFDRYRYEMKSDPLWIEIKYVLDHFGGAPMLNLFKQTLSALLNAQKAGASPQLVPLFEALGHLCKIFHSLNSQDLPEFFEDHIKEYMEALRILLTLPKLVESSDAEEPSVQDSMKAAVCDCLMLYAQKYEPFHPFVKTFVDEIWKQLMQTSEQRRDDEFVTSSLKFLTSVVRQEWNKKFFSNMDSLKMICERVVIPQLKLRETDHEMFSTDGVEWVRRDMEGSDVDTRRRICTDFVRGLCIHFEKEVASILLTFVNQLLEQASKGPQFWGHKDVAIYVVMALAVKGATARTGVTKTSPFVNVGQFFQQVVGELQGDVKQNPILKADCIKFVMLFRSLLPKEIFQQLIPLMMRYLQSDQYVVHTYAAACIERLLSVKDEKTGVKRFDKQQLQPMLKKLLEVLAATLSSNEESKENEYVMKAIMRVCAVAQETMAPFCGSIIGLMMQILARVIQNPVNPRFNHYLFETLASLVHFIVPKLPTAVENFETALVPPFLTALEKMELQEFGPYFYQIFAMLVELRPTVSKRFQAMFPSLLQADKFTNIGNAPALSRLLRAFIAKREAIVLHNLPGILGVFQKLLAIRKVESDGIWLLCSVVQHLPLEAFSKFLGAQGVFNILVTRLMSARGPSKLTHKNFIYFCSVLIVKHGIPPVVQSLDQLEKGVFAKILASVWIPNVKLLTHTERRVVSRAMTALIASPLFTQPPYSNVFRAFVDALLEMFTAPEEKMDKSDLVAVAEEGYSAAFVRLAFAPEPTYAPLVPENEDLPRLFVQALQQITTSAPRLKQSLQALKGGALLASLLTKYGVQI